MKHWILSKFYIIVQLYFISFSFFNRFYVRHGLNKQVSAYKFLSGITRVLTSIKMYHISAKFDTKLFLAPYKASSRSRATKLAIEICLQ